MIFNAVVISIWAWPHISVPVTVDAEDELDALPKIVKETHKITDICHVVKGGIPFPTCNIGDLIVVNGAIYAFEELSFTKLTIDEAIMWQQMTSGEAIHGYEYAKKLGRLEPARFLRKRNKTIIELAAEQMISAQERELYDQSSDEQVVS